MTGDDIERVLDLLMRIAAGEPDVRAPVPSDRDEPVDAILVGLNMLAEDLEHEREMRKEAEALLRDERDSYHLSPALLCSVDVETLLLVKCNETLATSLGTTASSLVGRRVSSLFVPEDRAAAEAAFAAAGGGSPKAVPELALQGDNTRLLVQTEISRTDEPSPRLRVVWRDITKERKLERQLIQAQKMEAVGRLSGGVAHDFNNILSVVLGSAELARLTMPAGHESAADLRAIEDAAQRGAALTNQLLAFSRQQVASPKPIGVGTHVRDLDRLLRRLLPESIELKLHLPDDDPVTFIDPSQLTQVVINLVVNARDAVAGEGCITIEVERVVLDDDYVADHLDVQPGAYALLSVSDDGGGMGPDVIGRVFEPFFTTKPVGEGSGLGLSVCYGIVRQAGGRIDVYSEPGRGTTVRVHLPVHGRPSESPRRVVDVDDPVGTERLLVVEDELALRNLSRRILERAGYRVDVAADGDEALAVVAAADSPIDLVVTDVVMPKVGGRDLVARLTAVNPALRALYVSGYTANSIVHNGILDDGAAFLAKPFTPNQLLIAVRRALDE